MWFTVWTVLSKYPLVSNCTGVTVNYEKGCWRRHTVVNNSANIITYMSYTDRSACTHVML